MKALTREEVKNLELENILDTIKQNENQTVYCKIPSHKSVKACIGMFNTYGERFVFLQSWNTVVCGYIFSQGKVQRFCTFINSRSSIHHIGLFARYADCFTGPYGYQEYKNIYVLEHRLSEPKSTVFTPADAENNFIKTCEKLLENRFKKKPYFQTDDYYNPVNVDL